MAVLCRLLLGTCISSVLAFAAAHGAEEGERIGRGRYLVKIAGCNECHTEGYARNFGKVPESEWMIGRAWGEAGPWGTTFPINVRLLLSGLTEDLWIDRVRHTATRPPMPWYNLRTMTDQDLRAMYAFIRFLGPAGKPAPEYLPPGESTEHPHVLFPADAPWPAKTGRTDSQWVSESADPLVHRGRYLAQVAWCNSCHTEGYALQAGDVPEDAFLKMIGCKAVHSVATVLGAPPIRQTYGYTCKTSLRNSGSRKHAQ